MILCAILRHIHLLLTIHLTGELAALSPRAFIVDQLSAGLPLMRLLAPDVPILFYCHFPDLLLAQGRQSIIKRLYRVPFDRLEEWSMGFAHAVAVNSNFTRGIVANTWPNLQNKVPTKVVYPCVDTHTTPEAAADEAKLAAGKKLILSINRFERKKDIGLAIKAFARIPEKQRRGARLVLAGGYDARVSENVLYHAELQTLATSLSLAHHTVTPSGLSSAALPDDAQVLFLLSVPNALKSALLRAARLLVYTPTNEHFGIVPLEAMLARVPVLAANTGGPVETVADRETGWLRDPGDAPAWADVMARCLALPDDQLAAMGAAGQRRVRELFGRAKMAQTLDESLDQIASLAEERRASGGGVGFGVVAGFIAVCALLAAWFLAF
ncbi:Alpha-1,3-mannosyltransferase-like protein [Metarhizium acridum]|nr:Alpha-1,3-mannosyltransferase-like protein [Metarhizium acridum]